MDRLKTASDYVIGCGFSVFQNLNAEAKKARKDLSEVGTTVLTNYHENKAASAHQIKKLANSIMHPLQTLENTGVVATLSLYFVSCYTPLFKSVFFVGSLATGYFTYQISNVRAEVQKEYFYFERLDKKEVSKEEFIKTVGDLGDRILANSSLMRTLTSSKSMKNFHKLGSIVEQMIEQVGDQSKMTTTLKKLEFLAKFYAEGSA